MAFHHPTVPTPHVIQALPIAVHHHVSAKLAPDQASHGNHGDFSNHQKVRGRGGGVLAIYRKLSWR